jgi:SAM-dependent methyltransferase
MSSRPSTPPFPSEENGFVRYHTPAATDEEVRRRHEANRTGWNQGAAAYSAEAARTIEFLRNGGSSLHPIERANLGELRTWCRTAVHLQCASGVDTLSLVNEGVAEVCGVDISDVHIENARATSSALGIDARWYRCDLLDTPHELDGWADLVYTGRGALCWLHDLDAWAAVVARLLKPGGRYHVFDTHPVAWLFEQSASTLVGSGINYFTHAESSQGWGEAYIGNLGRPAAEHARKYEQLWPIGAIFAALRRAGLTVDHLGEHPDSYWTAFPNLPPEVVKTFPQTFSISGTRPPA